MALNLPIDDWSGRVVWLVGASSGIGRATAALLHARGAVVVVSARSADALDAFVDAHPGAMAIAFDATDRLAAHDAARRIVDAHGRIDLVVYAAGTYAPLRATAFDLDVACRHLQVNVGGAWVVLDAVLPVVLRQGHGHISLMASVAGFRGLPKALAYGPTKAALINMAETLYLDLKPRGIGTSVINPGFVETPLTAQNDFKMPALISADEAARQIVRGWERGAFEIHFPRRFTSLMKLLRLLPHRLYFAIAARTAAR